MAVDPFTSLKRIVTTRLSAVNLRTAGESFPSLLICISLLSFLLESHLVYIAPHPILAGFKGLDDRVLGGIKMLGGMLILRIIAATHVSAGQA
jgi:hypothetical protein